MSFIQLPTFKIAAYMMGNPHAKKLALVLPGQLDTKDYPHMRSHVDFLQKKEYLAVAFDPPGTWESPGDISIYTITNYIVAINELIAHFGNKPTILVGHSRGGSVAMLAGAAHPIVRHCVAIMSPMNSSNEKAETKARGYQPSYRDLVEDPASPIKKKFLLPYNYYVDAKKYDVISAIKKSTKPKLFFHGTEDVLVTSEEIKEGFTIAANPKMMHELHVEHNYRLHPEAIKEVEGVIEKFISHN